jgi:hypothetical protein
VKGEKFIAAAKKSSFIYSNCQGIPLVGCQIAS